MGISLKLQDYWTHLHFNLQKNANSSAYFRKLIHTKPRFHLKGLFNYILNSCQLSTQKLCVPALIPWWRYLSSQRVTFGKLYKPLKYFECPVTAVCKSVKKLIKSIPVHVYIVSNVCDCQHELQLKKSLKVVTDLVFLFKLIAEIMIHNYP